MRPDEFQGADKYTEKHRKKRRWHRIMACLAGVVVFCTVYLLMMPAVTLEKAVEENFEEESMNSENSIQEDMISEKEEPEQEENSEPEEEIKQEENSEAEEDAEQEENSELKEEAEQEENSELKEEAEQEKDSELEEDAEAEEDAEPKEEIEQEKDFEQAENPEQMENPEQIECSELSEDSEILQEEFLSTGKLNGYIENVFSNGGEFVLEGDSWTEQNGQYANLAIEKDITIDLNGHTLYISKAGQWFSVKSGATLTIKDSAAVNETITSESETSLHGNLSSLDEQMLTYYVTESVPTDDGTGTTETLKKHTLDLTKTGKIQCSDSNRCSQAFLVEGGTLKLESGVLRNSTGGHVVCVNSGTLSMSGGYIVGGDDGYGGGGVYTSGTMIMTGGVIAANKANQGGGIYAAGGELNLSGGVVAGNEVYNNSNGHGNGGGIYVRNAALNLSGNAYVTNNRTQNCCTNDTNNKHGGGGITLGESSSMQMTGGYVTGNDTGLAGGGIYAGFFGLPVTFTMSGGIIARNYAKEGEGGGLRIGGGTNGVIKASSDNHIYITNNQTDTPDDWGGGGIFIQDKGNLNVTNVLITDNFAGGFGGGIGVCPTGETLIVHTEGGAVYGNDASGENMSAGGNGKNYDATLAKASQIFMENGYKDFFCVRSKNGANNYVSLVTGEMVGGGAANWSGSCDENPVSISKTGYAAAKYLFGLTSNPDDGAVNSAKEAANVIISGNISKIHGGGIMTNGGLILGKTEGDIVTTTPSLDISGTKGFLKDGVSQSSGLDFQFQLKDENGTVVGTASSDAATGVFTISPNINGTQEGTYHYYLSEVNDGKNGVVYDTTQYKIEIVIAKNETTLLGVKFVSYKVSSATVTKIEEDTSNVQVPMKATANADGSYLLVFEGNAFTNTKTTPLDLKIVKTDQDNVTKLLQGAKFTLKKEGQETTAEMTTDESGEATFSNIQKNPTYYLYETEPPANYMTAGPWILEIGEKEGFLYPAEEQADGTLVKTEGTGTAFTVTEADSIMLEMKISDQSWGYVLPDTGGLGTTGYTLGGLAFIISALVLRYILTKRRKEDEVSF